MLSFTFIHVIAYLHHFQTIIMNNDSFWSLENLYSFFSHKLSDILINGTNHYCRQMDKLVKLKNSLTKLKLLIKTKLLHILQENHRFKTTLGCENRIHRLHNSMNQTLQKHWRSMLLVYCIMLICYKLRFVLE